MEIDVVYLARGADYGINAALEFLKSYAQKDAGVRHTLHIATKAWEGKEEEYVQLKKAADLILANIIELPDDGFDLGAYYRVSKVLKGKYIFFFATSSLIEKSNWLKFFLEALENNKQYKAAGSFSSYEECPIKLEYLQNEINRIYKEVQTKEDPQFKFYRQVLKEYVKNPLPFPNYHIRSNGFLIERELFIEYMEQNQIPGYVPRYKVEAWALESGHNSLTKFIEEKGYEACVVGANGIVYKKEDWHKSNTFRWFNTSNAIVSDMESRKFHQCSDKKKLELIHNTWNVLKNKEIHELEQKTKNLMKIFVVYHKESFLYSNDVLLPIQTGKSHEKIDLGIMGDNTKDNISEKNTFYGELTAHYWVWRNYLEENKDLEYVGFAHYRRFIDLNPSTKAMPRGHEIYNFKEEDVFRKEIIEYYYSPFLYSQVEPYDLVIPRIHDFAPRTIYTQYDNSEHPLDELELLIKIILEKHPEYKEAIEEVFNGTSIYLSTIFIMKKELFEELCAWILPLLFELEKRSDWSKYLNTYNQRIPAFLHERFFNVWLVHKMKEKSLKILEKECLMFGESNNVNVYDKSL